MSDSMQRGTHVRTTDRFRPNRRTVMKVSLAGAGLGVVRIGATTWAQGAPPDGTPPPGGPGGPGETPGAGGPQGGGTVALDEFVGVTTDGNVAPDLFPIAFTGNSTTASLVDAATGFLAALTEEQRAATLFAVDDDEWRKWSNIDSYHRQGTSLRDMDDVQKAAAMGLLSASLSATGYEKVDATIKLNHTEGELMDNLEGFGEDLYWFTVMGESSTTEP